MIFAQIELTESVHGSNSMDQAMPIMTSVYVRIGRGRLVFADDETEYYALAEEQLRSVDALRRSKSTASLSKKSCHLIHREKLFRAIKGKADEKARAYRSSPDPRKHLVGVFSEKLCFDYVVRHFGGGIGMEISPATFTIVRPNSTTASASSSSPRPDNAPLSAAAAQQTGPSLGYFAGHQVSVGIPLHAEDVHGDLIVLASKFHKEFTGNRDQPVRAEEEDQTDTTIECPPIRYSQQLIGNLLRCEVNITDSIFVVHLGTILPVVSFFVDPVDLLNFRGVEVMLTSGVQPLDFNAFLDVEVHTRNTSFCLPRPSPSEDTSLFCVHGNVDYTQACRGFMQVGNAVF